VGARLVRVAALATVALSMAGVAAPFLTAALDARVDLGPVPLHHLWSRQTPNVERQMAVSLV
jgi:hypothetical protein